MPTPQTVTSSLLVRDVQASASFYRSVLWSHSVGFEAGATTLQLPDGSRIRLGQDKQPGDRAFTAEPREIRGVHAAVPTLSLDEWTRHLFMNGVVLERTESDGEGATHLSFHDPDGNLLVVVVPPNAN